MTENALSRIPVITQAILDAQPLDFHARKLDELQVLRLMADKMKANVELKNDIAEAQLIIYRNAGLRFKELFKPGGDGSNQHRGKEAIRTPVRLADYGINNRIADICRKIAVLPDDLFDNLILGIRTTEHITHQEITTAFFYNAGRVHAGYDNQRSDRVSIPIDDPILAAQLIRRKLTTQNVAQLIDELRKLRS